MVNTTSTNKPPKTSGIYKIYADKIIISYRKIKLLRQIRHLRKILSKIPGTSIEALTLEYREKLAYFSKKLSFFSNFSNKIKP